MVLSLTPGWLRRRNTAGRQKDWDRAVDEIVHILFRLARRRDPTFYGELAPQVVAIRLEPSDFGMAAILGEISEAEDANGRGMLSALLVNMDMSIPGEGFFKLAKRLGRDTSDPFVCWKTEFDQVCDYWSRRG
jgi:hypothetical protein